MKTSTNKTFSQNLATVKASSKTAFVALQNAIIQGLADFLRIQDAGLLTRCVETADATLGINVLKVKGFIELHANVRWVSSKNKDGDTIARFKMDKTDYDHAEIVEPEMMWTEFESSKTTAQPKTLEQVLRIITNFSEGKKCTKDAQKFAKMLLESMETKLEKVA